MCSNFEKFYLPLQPLLLPLGLYRAMVSTVARYLRIFPTDEHVVSVFSILIPGKIKFFFRAFHFENFAHQFFITGFFVYANLYILMFAYNCTTGGNPDGEY